MIELQHFLALGAVLFATGLYGVLARRNAILVLMSVELMLNAVNVNLIAFATFVGSDRFLGQVFAVFVICIAAAEAGLGLAIVLRANRNRGTINLDEFDLLKW